jgi:hypothetical protein
MDTSQLLRRAIESSAGLLRIDFANPGEPSLKTSAEPRSEDPGYFSVAWGGFAALLELVPRPAEVVSCWGDVILQNSLAHRDSGRLHTLRSAVIRGDRHHEELSGTEECDVLRLTLEEPETHYLLVYSARPVHNPSAATAAATGSRTSSSYSRSMP